MDTLPNLRTLYMDYLASQAPVYADGAKRTVAGRETRKGLRHAAGMAAQTASAWSDLGWTWQKSPQDVFVWSDQHLGHENIIAYTNRPFGNAAATDAAMLAAAQAAIRPEQWLVFVGDVALWKDPQGISTWLAACPGRKAIVLGNHDLRGRAHPDSADAWAALGFEAVADVATLAPAHGLPQFWITHYPLPSDIIPQAVINLHGHTHNRLVPGPHLSACVEITGYRPRNLLEYATGIREP